MAGVGTMDNLKHGSCTTYTYHGCRCDECKRAQREYMRSYRSTRQGRRRTNVNNAAAAARAWRAAQWVRENRPDVWADIRSEVAP